MSKAKDPTSDDQKPEADKVASGPKMSAEHPILTTAEVDEIRAEARKQVEQQRKKSARKQLLEIETARLAKEEGLITGISAQDELVGITMDLAEHSACVVINMRPYWHGHTYQVPRHVAETLREIMQRGHLHQNEIDGKSRTHFYQQARETSLSPVAGAKNAPRNPGLEVR